MSDNIVVIVLIFAATASLLSASRPQINILQNYFGTFGVESRVISSRNYHVWIFAVLNISSLSDDTVHMVTLNFNSTSFSESSCGGQYVYIYKQSNASTLLVATYSGADLQSGSLTLLTSQVVTVTYQDTGQGDFVGFNATYSIIPLDNVSYQEHTSNENCTGFYHHIVVYDNTRDKMVLYGGIDHQGNICNSMIEINSDLTNREYIHTLEGPISRYLHSGIIFNNLVIVYGGKNATSVNGELWKFDVTIRQWSRLHDNVVIYGHTATVVDECMIVVGGMNSTAVNSNYWKYNITDDLWETLMTSGAKPTSIIGHTAAYDTQLNSLLVYGGIQLVEWTFEISASLYSLDMRTLQWSILQLKSSSALSLTRLFSASVIIDRNLYVLGGLQKNGKSCYAERTLIFALNSTCGYIPVIGAQESTRRFGIGAIALENGTVLISGGYHTKALNDVTIMTPPQDLCTLLTTNDTCFLLEWCHYCYVDTLNTSCCVSNDNASAICDGAVVLPGNCPSTSCMDSTTCGSCLSDHFHQQRSCQWCPCSENCISSSEECARSCFFNFVLEQNVSTVCYFSQCEAATCRDCVRQGCVWMHQLEHLHGDNVRIFDRPDEWRCFSTDLVNTIIRQTGGSFTFTVITDVQECPLACASYKSCSTCINAYSHVAGLVTCKWLVETGECVSYLEASIKCTTGDCGAVISDEGLCHDLCNTINYCHSCLEIASCIWCHVNGSNGEGSCVELKDIAKCLQTDAVIVNYECPAENECLNGHNDCFEDQQCNDTISAFTCTCPHDYIVGTNSCVPVCTGNCSNNGLCISPHTCQCYFGYTGENCSTQCECNGHSECVDDTVDGRHTCLECLHSTQGESCELCQPHFAGSGTEGCLSCLEFCNGNSNICVNSNAITSRVRGPFFNESTCLLCQNNTTGRYCNECIPEYYHHHSSESFSCIQCPCNGYGSTCNNETGLECGCNNNTKTVCPISSEHDCRSYQCNTCADGYVGVPVNGNQCYHMLNFSSIHPETLTARQSMFYAVQPKYSNRDITLVVSVTQGNLDVFISNSSQTITVGVNTSTWEHYIELQATNQSSIYDAVASHYNVNGRLMLEFSHQTFNLQNVKFYVAILSKDSDVKFSVIFYQDILSLSWFSLVMVLLSSITITFMSVVMIVHTRRQWNLYMTHRLYKQTINKRLLRPFSKMHVLINQPRLFENNITQIFCRPRLPDNPKPPIPVNPLSVQPTADSRGSINAVLIQLPNSSNGHVNFTTGICLDCRDSNTSRLETKISPM